MNSRLFFLLAGLALLPAAASAQTLASAEQWPGRIVLVPFSVEHPAGDGWILMGRSETAVTFMRNGAGVGQGFVARAIARPSDQPVKTVEALLEQVRSQMSRGLDDTRFRSVSEDAHIDASVPGKCVRFHQKAEYRGAPAQPDNAFPVIELIGRSCVHPDDERMLIDVTYSEGAPPGKPRADIAAAADKFIAGVRYHVPLRGEGWRSLAEKGDNNAQAWLGLAYLTGRGVASANEVEGAAWMRKAAEGGNLEAQALLGLFHFSGHGAAKDAKEALKWLRPAAEKGYPKAEGLIGFVLIAAEEVRDTAEGMRWLKKAAQDDDPFAQLEMGELLVSGRAGLEKNETEGAAWYRKAAAQGNARAQYALGAIHAAGLGVAKDMGQALFWLRLAAAQGSAEAKKALDSLQPPPPPAAKDR